MRTDLMNIEDVHDRCKSDAEQDAASSCPVNSIVGRCWVCGQAGARKRQYRDGRKTREDICSQCWVDMAAAGYPIDHPNQSTRCAWCGKPLSAGTPSVTVQNTDDDGIMHRIAWCALTECTKDPVYAAVCESRRIPGNALMVLAERQRETLRTEKANAPVQRRAAQRTVRCNRLLDGILSFPHVKQTFEFGDNCQCCLGLWCGDVDCLLNSLLQPL